MTEYCRVIYINTRQEDVSGALPTDVGYIRDWCHLRSATVRWSCVDATEAAGRFHAANLVVLDWSSRNSNEAEAVCNLIREDQSDLPILIVESYKGQTPTRDSFVAADARATVLDDPSDSSQIDAAITALNIKFSAIGLTLHPDPNDPEVNQLIEWVGPNRLPLMLQKFCPEARNAYIVAVGGGWSAAKLCRFWVDTDNRVFFLKFFTQREGYLLELARHSRAKEWLGDSIVDLALVKDLSGPIVNQIEIFPQPENNPQMVRYPVCYESASTRDSPRKLFRELYREMTNDAERAVMERILTCLASNQPSNPPKLEPPWSSSSPNSFALTDLAKRGVLDAISDLDVYGAAMCGGDRKKWKDCREAIQRLAEYRAKLPPWLSEALPVAVGHIHGDPNPRNCLIDPRDPNDIRFIDCGGYRPDGRLVSDLALIERDTKLVLMATDKDAAPFLDLDPTQLPDWCHAESYSLSQRLMYGPEHAAPRPRSISRAYHLIGQVRRRARQVCGNGDSQGIHYFAALLYWTLDVLQYPAIRPTKKLLALFSAADLLHSFE